MIKRSLLFVLIAVVSAGLLVIGCNTGTSSDSSTVAPLTPDGQADAVVGSAEDLVEALDDSEVAVADWVLSGSGETLTERLTIPPGKTVTIKTTADSATVIPTKGLVVQGKLIVGESTILAAETNGKVILYTTGTIQIQAGGQLRTETRISVAGENGDSALKRVQYDRGSALTITGEGEALNITAITALWDDTISGARSIGDFDRELSVLILEDNLEQVQPSDFGTVTTGEGRWISAKPAKIETGTSLTIPAGIALAPTAGVLAGITDLTVAGELEADRVGATAAGVKVVVEGTGSLKVTTPIKFNAGSEIAAGGEFNGTPAASSTLTAAPGAKINGGTVKPGAETVFVSEATQLSSLAAGKIYQVTVSGLPVATSLTIPAGATLYVPTGVELTLSGTPAIVATSAGTVIIEGTGTVTGLPKFTTEVKDNSNNLVTGPYNPAGLELTSVTKNLDTGDIAIKLGGKIEGVRTFTGFPLTYLWTGAGAESARPAGSYSWATFDNLLSEEAVKTDTVIKQTNEALRYYTGATVITDPAAKPTTVPGSTPDIYLGPDEAFKWKKYTSAFPAYDQYFGVLLWSVASPKKATLDIKPADAVADDGYIVTVDWSGVTFTNP